MKKFATAVVLATTAIFGTVAAGAPQDGDDRVPVSDDQYRTLVHQCRYADTVKAREACRVEVLRKYRIGESPTALDCRTYSGVTVCGTLKLSAQEKECVRDSVSKGLTRRRAEVECYALT